MKKGIILIIFLLIASMQVSLASWFSPDTPPPWGGAKVITVTAFPDCNAATAGLMVIYDCKLYLCDGTNWMMIMELSCAPSIYPYLNIYGYNMTRDDGNTTRNFTNTFNSDVKLVYVDSFLYHPQFQWNIEGNTVLIYPPVYNTSFITLQRRNFISNLSFKGSNLNGSDGETNRVFNNTNTSIVFVDDFVYRKGIDYNLSIDGNITFFTPIWDNQNISLYTNNTISQLNYYGASCSGVDGSINRILNIGTGNVTVVSIDGFVLHPARDYTYNGSITFLNNVWDTEVISIWK